MVHVEHLGKRYPPPLGRFGKSHTALVDVAFEAHKGEIVAIVGPNGAGKSTLLKILVGLLLPDEGTVTVLDQSPLLSRGRIGMVHPEERSFSYRLSIAENLSFYGRLHGLPSQTIRTRSEELLSTLGLDVSPKERFGRLSSGQKQRVAIARGLLHDPDLLLLDEPTRGLDPLAVKHFRDLVLAYLSKDRTILLASHNLHEVESLAHRVVLLHQGKVKAIAPPGELALKLGLEKRFRLTLRHPWPAPIPQGWEMFQEGHVLEGVLNMEALVKDSMDRELGILSLESIGTDLESALGTLS